MIPITDASALEFAGFWRRLAARIVDVVACAIVVKMISLLLPFSREIDRGFLIYTSFFINTFSLLFRIAYHVGFWTLRGQTPGKILLNIKVIRTDGSDISLGYAALRYLGYLISAAALGLGLLWITFDARKQGWHDKIADTYVIKLSSPTPREVFPAAKPSAG